MKTRFVNVLGLGAVAAATSVASADFVGWTANSRAVSGGFLVNVYAVTNSSTDVILNVYGGTLGQPSAGSISTTAAGGFKQGTATQSVWAPAGSQSWTTLDSFLTVGGGLTTSSGNWTGNSASAGDPPWNVTYFDSALEENVTVNAFNTQSNADGFTNPYSNNIPATGGYFIAGASSPARSLATLTNRIASSNAAAAAGTFGMMVGQFYVATASVQFVNMGATLQRADGTLSQAAFSLDTVPAPGALALLGIAGFASRRRRA
jgi:MYXO-CTERM domain-containing protein